MRRLAIGGRFGGLFVISGFVVVRWEKLPIGLDVLVRVD